VSSRLSDWLKNALGKRKTPAPAPAPTPKPASNVAVARASNRWFERFLEESGFLSHYPHYAGVIARMTPIATPLVPVMAVALAQRHHPRSRIHLLVNCDFFDRYPEFRLGILLHEVQHVVCGHLDDVNLHRVAYPRVMELAMEISANEYVTAPLPGGAIRHQEFVQFGVAAKQSTLERYRLLRGACERGRLDVDQLWSPRMLDTHSPRGLGDRASGLADLLDARSDRSSERNWSRSAGLSPPDSRASIERMKEAIARHLRGERGGSDDPNGDRDRDRVAKELERPVFHSSSGPILDWRRILAEAFPRRRQVTPDYLRPNRRFPARVGEIPGRRRRPPKPRLLVGVDTSGSMDGDALARIGEELSSLARHARLTIIECDAVVQRIYPFTAALQRVTGGGDTDFAPVFAAATREYEGLVYFTDGKGALPALTSELPTVWALTNDDPFLAAFGVVVRLAV